MLKLWRDGSERSYYPEIFSVSPQDAVRRLEKSLTGKPLGEAGKVLAEFYGAGEVETPGITVQDWMQVLVS
jgi:hypothetical protein